jgi:hypothetical protein
MSDYLSASERAARFDRIFRALVFWTTIAMAAGLAVWVGHMQAMDNAWEAGR